MNENSSILLVILVQLRFSSPVIVLIGESSISMKSVTVNPFPSV
jgi:hypothetical protein